MGNVCSSLCNCGDKEDEYTTLMNLATKNPFAQLDRENKEATRRFFNRDKFSNQNQENTQDSSSKHISAAKKEDIEVK